MIHLAIDGMGGDDAPKMALEASLNALKDNPNLTISFFGDLTLIDESEWSHERLDFIATSEVVTGEDEPVRAIRRKKDSSMVRAARFVKEGQADALVSAGNTGALLASGLLIIGRIRGIDRPGIMPVLPTISKERPRLLLMDAGANAECTATNLHQFAYLAQTYAQRVLKIDQPLVGLLNNGEEASKGDPLRKEVYDLLSEDDQIQFYGNIEGHELLTGQVDIAVTDGFTGNAVLKSIEGTAKSLLTMLSHTLKNTNLKTKVGAWLAQDALQEMALDFDATQEGGAILLGVRAPVIKAHGSSNSEAFYYAIQQAIRTVDSQIVTEVSEHFESIKE